MLLKFGIVGLPKLKKGEYLKDGVSNPECIISLKKIIMFLNLMKIKIQKYDLKKGW